MATRPMTESENSDIDTASRESLSVGDRIVDRDEDPEEFSPMRVVNPDVGEANSVEIENTDSTVADYPGNEQYPDTDTVVMVAFESSLDGKITGWTDRADDLDTYLTEFREEWSVSVDTYPYPRSRLKEVPDTVID